MLKTMNEIDEMDCSECNILNFFLFEASELPLSLDFPHLKFNFGVPAVANIDLIYNRAYSQYTIIKTDRSPTEASVQKADVCIDVGGLT